MQKGSSISRQNFNENLETHHLALTLFNHIPGFYLEKGFFNPHHLSLIICAFKHTTIDITILCK